MREKETHLHPKLKKFCESLQDNWMSPLIPPSLLGDYHPDTRTPRVDWQIIVRKEEFFNSPKFLRVLIADRESWLERDSPSEDLQSFLFPNTDLAIVQNFTSEIKRII